LRSAADDDATGNLKAAQKLGHASISTTRDIYANWDIDQLADKMRPSWRASGSFPSPCQKALQIAI
jgi:hypothetical protein